MARLSFAASFIVAVMLLVSAFPHIVNNYRFLGDFYAYRLIPGDLGLIAAAVIPYLQLVLALALLLFDLRTRRIASAYSCGMFLIFLVAQIVAIGRNLSIACGCFGGGERTLIGWRSISVAAAGLVLSLLIWCLCSVALRRNRSTDPS
jgi:hypothetical protein